MVNMTKDGIYAFNFSKVIIQSGNSGEFQIIIFHSKRINEFYPYANSADWHPVNRFAVFHFVKVGVYLTIWRFVFETLSHSVELTELDRIRQIKLTCS